MQYCIQKVQPPPFCVPLCQCCNTFATKLNKFNTEIWKVSFCIQKQEYFVQNDYNDPIYNEKRENFFVSKQRLFQGQEVLIVSTWPLEVSSTPYPFHLND